MGELHTAERWRREGREVEAPQLGQPAKRIKKRGQGGGGKKVPGGIDEPAGGPEEEEEGAEEVRWW